MLKWIRSFVLLTLIALAATMLPAVTAQADTPKNQSPDRAVPVDAGSYLKIQNQGTQHCLDTDGSRVYTGVCDSTDPAQKWYAWSGGWLKSAHYWDRCVQAQADGSVVARSCLPVNDQYWRFWSPEWIQSIGRQNTCLWANNVGQSVITLWCQEEFDRFFWRVSPW